MINRFLFLILLLFTHFNHSQSTPPPNRPPNHLWKEYTLNHTIPIQGWYFDSTSSTSVTATNSIRTYQDIQLNQLFQQAIQRIPQIDVYPETDKWMFQAFEQHPILNQRILIIGSQVPWYEMLAIAFGASQVVVVEYQPISYIGKWSHQLQYITPSELWNNTNTKDGINIKQLNSDIEPFDVIISISSEEHNGLGRYGDPLSPNGDIDHVSALSKISKTMFLAVPSSQTDCIVWNAHRIYGPIRWKLLSKEWIELNYFGDRTRIVPSCEQDVLLAHTYQPVYVLESKHQNVEQNRDKMICPVNPTLDSALMQYKETSAITTPPVVNNKKWIIYSCNCIHIHGCSEKFQENQYSGRATNLRPGCSCGGMGDRMNGIISSFVLAMITGRSFAIDWSTPCTLKEHLIPNNIHWNTKIWQSYLTDAKPVGCMSLFDYPPNSTIFQQRNLTLIMEEHQVVRISTNVNLLPFLWSNVNHGDAMHLLFGDNEEQARPLLTKHFGCLFDFLFQLAPQLQKTVNHFKNKIEIRQRKSIGVQVRLGGKWDLDLMEVQSDFQKWIEAIERRITKEFALSDIAAENNKQHFDIFVTSDQSTVYPYISKHFKKYPHIRVMEITDWLEDVHLDHVDVARPVANPTQRQNHAVTGTETLAPETASCASSIGKMFVDWWLLGECDIIFASMSGFGASAIWRTRHNDSYIVHAWEEYNREVKEKHYLYYTDWQLRTPLGDDGERVRVEVPTVV